jgi:hypothetical protein
MSVQPDFRSRAERAANLQRLCSLQACVPRVSWHKCADDVLHRFMEGKVSAPLLPRGSPLTPL